MNILPPKAPRRRPINRLDSLTLRGFGGGLNKVDSDIGMEPRYLVTLNNFYRTPNGSQRLRYGTAWFANVSDAVAGDILDMEYFVSSLIVPTVNGEIVAVDAVGAKVAIWNTAIAAVLPGTPSGWSTGLTSIDFVPFKRELVLHNGIDKPVSIDVNNNVTYLQDLATGSNIFVPIGKFGCVVSNYHCVAGIPAQPTTVYISAAGTSGTFVGAPAPNDGISVDVGAYAPEGASEIRGIAGFRSNLLVFFRGQTLVIKLGVYNSAGIHVPEFPDAMPSFGLLGHRCIVQLENDISFAGNAGLSSAKRNLLSGLLDSSTLSDLVEPLYRRYIGQMDADERQDSTFIIQDNLQHNTTLYLPTLGVHFNYSANDKLHYKGWSTYTGPAWSCGCASYFGRVFFGLGTKIFLQGNSIFDEEQYHADKVLDHNKTWAVATLFDDFDLVLNVADGKVYTCLIGHMSGNTTLLDDLAASTLAGASWWELYRGEPIDFEMEPPWLDSKDPMKVKQVRFISVGSVGTAGFTVEAYVDNLYKDFDNNPIYNPALSMTFVGNDSRGFGIDVGPYGGSRRSTDPRLFSFPVKFKTLKIRLLGSTRSPLEISNVSFLFSRGRYRR